MLTAVRQTKVSGVWEFICDCGVVSEKNIYSVKCHGVMSCGCYRKKVVSDFHSIDKVGKKFGRLLVIKKLGIDKHRHTLWECLCDCGKKTITTTVRDSSGTKSCGCIRIEKATENGKLRKQENPVSKTREYKSAQKKKSMSIPEKYLHAKISTCLRRAIREIGSVKKGKTFDILGYSPSQLTRHIERQFLNGMNWENSRLWEIDHIIPISSAKNIDDVIRLNQLSNLRPLWAEENNRKAAKRIFLI